MEGIKEKKVRAYDTDIALEIHADQNRLSYTEIIKNRLKRVK